jgi:GTPase involved in cell partitioning and DNA repair
MNYLQNSLDKIKNGNRPKDSIDNIEFILTMEGKTNDRQVKTIEEKVKKYDDKVKEHHDLIDANVIDDDDEKWEKQQNRMQKDVVDYIRGLTINAKTMQILIYRALSDDGMDSKYKKKILNSLYLAKKETFLSIFKESKYQEKSA